MDSRTGELYPSREAALKSGVPADDLVMIEGDPVAVSRVSLAVKDMFKRLPPKRRRVKMNG